MTDNEHEHDPDVCLTDPTRVFEWCSQCRAIWDRQQAVRLSLRPDFSILDTPIGLANEEDGASAPVLTDEQIDDAAWEAALEDSFEDLEDEP